MEVLVPGFEPRELESLEEVEVGVAWTELADPLVRARVEEAAARFPRRSAVDLPLAATGVHRSSCARPPTSTAGSSRSTPTLRRERRGKLELCLAVTRPDVERATGARGVPGAVRRRARRARPAVTPTLPIVAPLPAAVPTTRRARGADPLHVPVLRARLAGPRAALRARRGRASGLGPARRPHRGGRARSRRGQARLVRMTS